tara:strand:+ start:189 stop:536 length:348 start_codon:yes stop_codon:yes gene_type:complete
MATEAPNRVREWRELRGLTLQQLAESLNTSSVQAARLENGERKLSPEWLERLGTALNCIPAELLPAHLYKPALNPSEERILAAYRSLDDAEQVRWHKAFLAFCAPLMPEDLALTS